MAGIFSNTTKTMLKNVIRHTHSHNKTVEEADMWQKYERQKELGGLDPSNPSFGHDDRCSIRNDRGDRRRNDYWNSRSEKRAYLSTSYRSRRAHMDDEEEKAKGGSSTSTYWMRQLDKLETSDPNRWDHSGYREMYPGDFRSNRSDSDSPRLLSHRRKRDRKSRTKKKKHRSRSKKTRETEKKSHRHLKPDRKRSPSISSSSSTSTFESDSESFDSSPGHHQKHQPISKRGRYDKTKSGRYASSDSSSSSESDSDSGSCGRGHSRGHQRKRRRKMVESSVAKKRRCDKNQSRRFASPDSKSRSCYSESDVDSRGRRTTRKGIRRKTVHDSSVSSSSTDRSDSVSLPETKKVKTQKSAHIKKTKIKKRSKLKKEKGEKAVHKKRANREEAEKQLVVKMWKEVNGHRGSPDSDFDRRLHKEISSQYLNLKRQYTQHRRPQAPRHGDSDKSRKEIIGRCRSPKQPNRSIKMNGNSSLASSKRRRRSSSSYSSDSN